MDLILESRLDARGQRFRLFRFRELELTRDDRSNLVRASRPTEFPNGRNDRSEVSGKL